MDIYDAAADMWTTDTLSVARSDISAVAVDDKVLFAGGVSASNNGFTIVDIYDVPSGEWTTSHLPNQHRGGDMAEASFEEKAFFIGGAPYYLNGTWGSVWDKVSIYDPANESWSMDTLIHPRVAMAATVWKINSMFAVGSTGQWEGFVR